MQGEGGGGSGGSSSGISNNGSMSMISKAEVVEQDYVGLAEVSSYPIGKRAEEEEEDERLDLGLGLSLGGKGKTFGYGEYCRILTAKDFPSMVSSASSSSSAGSGYLSGKSGIVGTKRTADSIAQEAASNAPSQVVGWPPIRSYRMNSLANQARASAEDNIDNNINKSVNLTNCNTNNAKNSMQEKARGNTPFVKVNMDGVPIGRKVDLSAHTCYETLAQALEDMFHRPTTINTFRPNGAQEHEVTVETAKASNLLDGSSEFVLTYEDREGDWMLVGDVPWRMFLNTVKRLRIMRASEANGLGPRFQDKGDSQRSKHN